jgi:hypothetical protein
MKERLRCPLDVHAKSSMCSVLWRWVEFKGSGMDEGGTRGMAFIARRQEGGRGEWKYMKSARFMHD